MEPWFHYNNLPICEWVSEACLPVVTTFMKYCKDHECDWQDDSVNIRVWTSTHRIYWWNIDWEVIQPFFPHVQQISYQTEDELVLQA